MTEEKIHPRDTQQAMAVRLALIEERNVRVDRNKAWETSWFRRILLMMVIYIFAALFLLIIHAENPLIAALVPPIGFILSTLTLPSLKKFWVSTCYKK